MNRVQPKSLGDAYPALCNFLKLTSLTLSTPHLALTVQVGQDWRHGGVMNYGQMPAAMLRELLSSQPMTAPTQLSTQLSLRTYSRSQIPTEDAIAPVLVGHLHSSDARYHLTVYVPGLAVDGLTEVQVKTFKYLSQQLLLCLDLAQPPYPAAPAPASSPLPTGTCVDVLSLSRVVSLGSGGPTHDLVNLSHPRLADLVAQMQACLSYGQLGQLLATYLPYFFSHESGQLVVFSEADPRFTVLTQWGDDASLKEMEQQCCYGLDQVLEQSNGGCRECRQCEKAKHPAHRTRCIVLGIVNQTTCIVQLSQFENEDFSIVQTALLKKLSEQILYVLQRLLLLEDLQDQALKDPLTGLLNRRHSEAILNSLCHAANGDQNISIILIDIDHFKVVNDTYGHQAGDVVLQNMGMLLRGHVRSQDIVCRYGGEEFLMVLLDTTPDIALRRAEKIRRAVKYVINSFNGKALPPLTISLGVASFPEHGETPHTLITQADKALYWAKNHGRDRSISVDQMLTEIEMSAG